MTYADKSIPDKPVAEIIEQIHHVKMAATSVINCRTATADVLEPGV